MAWVKICGITNLEDAMAAVEAGADAVGFVFYEKSSRNIDPESARMIAAQLPREIEKIGVFVNSQEDAISAVAQRAGLTGVQFHGNDEEPHVAGLVVQRNPKLKVLVGISMNDRAPESSAMMWDCDSVHAFLLDSGGGAVRGGSGIRFDWTACRASVNTISRLGRIVVAGGLTPENVGESMRVLSPWGVDVSSGVELSPGKKDAEKVHAFVVAVRAAEKSS